MGEAVYIGYLLYKREIMHRNGRAALIQVKGIFYMYLL